MRRPWSPASLWRAPLLRRLDHAAREINPILMVVAAGLAVVYLGCLLAAGLGRLHAHHPTLGGYAEPAPALGQIAVGRPPQS